MFQMAEQYADKFHTPAAVRAEPEDAPVNALGIRRIMFAVDDIESVLGRLRRHGAELVGEVVQNEDRYRLCYVRGPEGHRRRTSRASDLKTYPAEDPKVYCPDHGTGVAWPIGLGVAAAQP